MRVPPDASPLVKQAFKAVNDRLDKLGASQGENVNAAGTRTINAGDAVHETDYTTYGQMKEWVEQVRAAERRDVLTKLSAAIRASTAPAAVANVPDWLLTIVSTIPT